MASSHFLALVSNSMLRLFSGDVKRGKEANVTVKTLASAAILANSFASERGSPTA
jgi:hypothetical protein